LLVLAKRDSQLLASFDVRVWLREHARPPEWAVWLASLQRAIRGEPQLGFWVNGDAPAGSYIVDFDSRTDLPGFRGIWRVLDESPTVGTSDGVILMGRRVSRIDGYRLGSNQAWRRAAGAARLATGRSGRWDLQTFAKRFL
jgi:hypothetical protein